MRISSSKMWLIFPVLTTLATIDVSYVNGQVKPHLPGAVIKQWEAAEFQVGWLRQKQTYDKDYRIVSFHEGLLAHEANDLPAFSFFSVERKPGNLAKLPVPKESFGLELMSRKITDDDIKPLEKMNNLKSLSLSLCKITDDGMKSLSVLKKLESLSLSGTEITDTGLKELAKLQQLRLLELRSTRVSDDGLKELKKLSSLEALDLNETQVTDRGLAHLTALKNLQVVFLLGNRITDNGLKDLAKIKKLQVLNLATMGITAKGLRELHGLDNLRLLVVGRIDPSSPEVKALRKRFPNLVMIFPNER